MAFDPTAIAAELKKRCAVRSRKRLQQQSLFFAGEVTPKAKKKRRRHVLPHVQEMRCGPMEEDFDERELEFLRAFRERTTAIEPGERSSAYFRFKGE